MYVPNLICGRLCVNNTKDHRRPYLLTFCPFHIQSQIDAFDNSKDDQRSGLLKIKLVFLFIIYIQCKEKKLQFD